MVFAAAALDELIDMRAVRRGLASTRGTCRAAGGSAVRPAVPFRLACGDRQVTVRVAGRR